MVVIIGLNGDVFTAPDMRDQFICPRTQICDDGGSFTAMTCYEGDVIRAIVWDWDW